MKKKTYLSRFLKITVFGMLLLLGYHFSQAQSKLWPVPINAVNTKNPLVKDAASIKIGKILYENYCTPCHGDKGKGDGVASAALNPKPANHTSPAIQAETDGSLFYKISTGHGAMPKYNASLNETQRWALVNYIRTLAKKPK